MCCCCVCWMLKILNRRPLQLNTTYFTATRELTATLPIALERSVVSASKCAVISTRCHPRLLQFPYLCAPSFLIHRQRGERLPRSMLKGVHQHVSYFPALKHLKHFLLELPSLRPHFESMTKPLKCVAWPSRMLSKSKTPPKCWLLTPPEWMMWSRFSHHTHQSFLHSPHWTSSLFCRRRQCITPLSRRLKYCIGFLHDLYIDHSPRQNFRWRHLSCHKCLSCPNRFLIIEIRVGPTYVCHMPTVCLKNRSEVLKVSQIVRLLLIH